MTKKRSIITFSIVSVLILVGLFLTFFKFTIPGTTTNFKGFFNAINYGYDVNGGYYALYKPADSEEKDITQKVERSVLKLNSTLSGYGFSVTKQKDNIRLEISKVSFSELNNKSTGLAGNIFSWLNTSDEKSGIIFADGEDYDTIKSNTKDYVRQDLIESCSYGYNQNAGGFYINVEFNEEGKTKFKELTQKIANSSDSKKLYIFINGECYNKSNGFSMTSGVSSLQLSSTSEIGAQTMALQFSVMSMPTKFDVMLSDEINAGLNQGTGFFGNAPTLLLLALSTIFIASIVLLCVRYRLLGVMASVSMLAFIILYSFLLQSIPLVVLDVSGILGVLFTYILLVGGMVTIFEKVRKEYAIGKKIPNSVASGFRKNLLPILEKYVFVLLITIVFFIIGNVSLKYFATSLFIGLFVNYFTLFVACNGLCRNLLPLNSTNKNLYNLKRGAKKNEI